MEFIRCFRCMEETGSYPCSSCGYDPKASPGQAYALRPGTILSGKYVVGTPLGQGGFGITYIGWDLSRDQKVAIKEYFPSGQVSRNVTITSDLQWYTTPQAQAAQGPGMQSFQKEARKMARVAGIPQVVDVRDVFEENQTTYIVMDFVAGQTLKDRLMKAGPLSWEEAQAIFLPAIQAMDKVHSKGLIHRDLSPDNLMLLPDGSVKILDLGAAKDLNVNSGASSMQVAKGGFSPLEQYTQRGGSGTWTDVYAMAATMYYSLTGVLPPAAVDRVAKDPLRWDLPQLTALPAHVLAALQKAMGLLQDQRTQTMAEFAKALTTPPKPIPKKRWPIWAGAAVLALVVGLSGLKSQPESDIKKEAKNTTPSASQAASVDNDEPELTLQDKDIPDDLLRYTDTRPEDFDNDSEYVDLLRTGTRETYTYTDGGTLDMYYDTENQERCRIYTDNEGQRLLIFTAEYTEIGEYRESRTYDEDGLLQCLELSEFNDQDKLTRKRTYDGNGTLYRLMEREYDSEGRLIALGEWTGSGKALKSSVYRYNTDAAGNGLLLSLEHDGTTRRNVRDADGNTLSYECYDAQGKREYRGEYTYDTQGRTVLLTYYSGNSQKSTSSTEYVYSGDLKIQEISHSYYGGKDNVTTYTLLYGPRNVSIGRKSDSYLDEYVTTISGSYRKQFSQYLGKSYGSRSITSYDYLGNSTSYTGFREDGSLSSATEYLYDAEGLSLGRTYTYFYTDGSHSVTEYDSDDRETAGKAYDADGSLKSRTEYTYEESQKWKRTYDATGTLTETVQTRYNENGDVLEEVTTDGSGELKRKYEYQYDADGNKTGHTYTYVSSYDGSTHIMTYDAEDRKLLEQDYNADGTLDEWTEYTYSDKETRSTTYDVDGTVTGSHIRRYDDKGNETSSESYDKDGQLSYKSEYNFDADGNKTGHTFTSYYSDGRVSVTEYNADGDETIRNIYKADGNLEKWTEYTYTADSKTEKTYDASGKLTEKEVYKYNANDDILSRQTYDGTGRLTDEWNYTYDANGKETGRTWADYGSDGSKVVYEYGPGFSLSWISKKTYDASGRLLSTETQ